MTDAEAARLQERLDLIEAEMRIGHMRREARVLDEDAALKATSTRLMPWSLIVTAFGAGAAAVAAGGTLFAGLAAFFVVWIHTHGVPIR